MKMPANLGFLHLLLYCSQLNFTLFLILCIIFQRNMMEPSVQIPHLRGQYQKSKARTVPVSCATTGVPGWMEAAHVHARRGGRVSNVKVSGRRGGRVSNVKVSGRRGDRVSNVEVSGRMGDRRGDRRGDRVSNVKVSGRMGDRRGDRVSNVKVSNVKFRDRQGERVSNVKVSDRVS